MQNKRFGLEQTVTESPPKPRNNYQSTRKYSSNHYEELIKKEDDISAKLQPRVFTPHWDPISRDQRGAQPKEETSEFDYPKKQAGRIADYK